MDTVYVNNNCSNFIKIVNANMITNITNIVIFLLSIQDTAG